MTPPRLAESLLSLLGAPEALLGDLHEGVGRHGRRWYWQQVFAFIVVATRAGVARHPWRALWWMTATTAIVAGLAQTARLRAQPDSAAALRAEVEASGWIAERGTRGELNVVPALRVRIRNASSEALARVQVMTVFRRAVDGIEWGNDWRPLTREVALPSGASTVAVVTRSAYGLVGPSTVDAVFRHPSFVDARVEVFARHGAQLWARVADVPVRRRLLEP